MSVGERVAAATNRLYGAVRHPGAHDVEIRAGTGLEELSGQSYALLTTFRKSGKGVPTPVWFGCSADRVYVRTEPDAGKVKRIRADGRALIGPCTVRGRPLGPMAECRARVLGAGEEPAAEAALQANYGLGRRLYEGAGSRLGLDAVNLEVAPGRSEGESA